VPEWAIREAPVCRLSWFAGDPQGCAHKRGDGRRSRGHSAHFVSELVDEVSNLPPFPASYTEVRGCPPYDPRLMLTILLYGCTNGLVRRGRSRCVVMTMCPGSP
jgi:hypothetical protein